MAKKTPVFPSVSALIAIQRSVLRVTAGADVVDPLHKQILETAGQLTLRWPPVPRGAYGIPVRGMVSDFQLYEESLSTDLLLLDHAERQPSNELLEIVADDLDAKLKDCEIGGDKAGPVPKLSFLFQTIKPPTEKVLGYRLMFADRKEIGLAKLNGKQPQFHPSPILSWSSVELAPGTYWMFVEEESSHARTPCQKITVGRQADLLWQFNVATAAKTNECHP